MIRKKLFGDKKGFLCCIPIIAIILVLILLTLGVIAWKDIILYLIWFGIIAIGWYIWKLWKEIKLDEERPKHQNYYKRNYRLP